MKRRARQGDRWEEERLRERRGGDYAGRLFDKGSNTASRPREGEDDTG